MQKKVFIYIAVALLLSLLGFGAFKVRETQTDEEARDILKASGMRFYGESVEKALLKAQAEQKFVMINFYASWCNVCRKMKTETFSNTRVNTFYNSNFINIAFNIEKEGKELAKKYQIEAFPTILFLNTKGKVIQKVTGFKNTDEFINLGKHIIQSN